MASRVMASRATSECEKWSVERLQSSSRCVFGALCGSRRRWIKRDAAAARFAAGHVLINVTHGPPLPLLERPTGRAVRLLTSRSKSETIHFAAENHRLLFALHNCKQT